MPREARARLACAVARVLALAAAPAALGAQTVTGRVVDSATRRPLAHVAVRLVPGADSARDTVYAAAETAGDGVFVLLAPAPGTYRVRLGGAYHSRPITLANVGAVDKHEYPIGAARPVVDTNMYYVLHGAALDSVVRSGRPLLECQVERPAATVPGTLYAAYPRELREAKKSGSLIVQFVVDTSGRAEMSTLTIWTSPQTDAAFGASAREGLARARFYPATSSGRKVRQLVRLPITFQFTGGREPEPLRVAGCAPLGDRPPEAAGPNAGAAKR